MCRLFGVFSRDSVDAVYYMLQAPQSMTFQSRVDKKRPQADGWGLGWFAGSHPRIFKNPRPLFRDKARVRKAVKQAKGHILLGHVRWASNPLKLPRKELIGMTHTQPFSHDSWLFIHNGTLLIPREVKAALGPWAKFVKGKNDSEVLFYWLLKTLVNGKGKNWAARLRQSFRGLDKIWAGCKKQYPIYKGPYHGLNWVLTNGRVFLAFCYVNSTGFGKAKALCSGKPYYELQVKQTDGEVVVASEPIAPDSIWQPLGHGRLLIAERRGRRILVKTQKVM